MKKKKIWFKKFSSFKEAEKAEHEYYSKMSPAKRICTVQMLRETWDEINGGKNGRCSERLPRVVRIIQPA